MMKRFAHVLLSLCLILCAATAFAAQEWICESCGSNENGNFCSNCGSKQPAQTWLCSGCGAENDKNFCSNCGTPRDAARQSADETASQADSSPLAALYLNVVSQGAHSPYPELRRLHLRQRLVG